ncbi:MAG: ATP-binding protein [Thalassolituus sp.]
MGVAAREINASLIHQDQLTHIANQMWMGSLGSIALAGFSIVLFWAESLAPWLIAWGLTVGVLAWMNYRTATVSTRDSERTGLQHLHTFLFLGSLTGLCWSLPAWWIISGEPEVLAPGFGTVFIIIAMMGMATSAMGSIGAYLPFYYVSVSPFILSLICACFIAEVEGLTLQPIGFALIIFTAAIYWFAYSHNRSLLQSFQRQHDNMHLAELYRAAKDDAEASSRAKSRFLAAASHDLRQPLHALGLYSELLSMDSPAAQQKNIVSKVRHSTDSLRTMLDQILDVSQVQADAIDAVEAPVAMREVFTILRNTFENSAADNGLELVFYGGNLSANTDRGMLIRILSNLISNSIRYTERGKVLVACRPHGNALKIQVTDSGLGIPAEQHSLIFEEYLQLNNPQRNRALGLGLGLSIVKGLCDKLNTQIELRSAPGRGSTFAFGMPRASTVNTSSEAIASFPAINTTSDTDTTVLLIDDDTDILQAATALLSQWGVSIASATNGSDAEHLLINQPADIIISDYRLVNEDGIELLSRLSKHYPDCRCVLLTGDTAPEILKRANDNGLTVIHKPLQPAKLKMLLQQRRTSAPVA